MADPHHLSRGQRLRPAAGALAALVLLTVGVLLVWQDLAGPGRTATEASVPVDSTPSVPVVRRAAGERASSGASQATQRLVPGVPRRIALPALGVDAAVDPIRLTGSTLVPPGDVQRVGWWVDGARPGARAGTALLTGHTVHDGGGVFDLLGELAPADRIRVGFGRREITYAVRSVRAMTTTELAGRSGRLFRQDGPGRLVLVTCTDWDGEAYRGSIVVVATPARNLP